MRMNDDLRGLWADAGYGSDFGSAAVVPPPPKEYLRVYYFVPADFAISNIGLRRIKVARVFALNDPFELMSLSFSNKEIKKSVKQFKERFDLEKGILCFSKDWKSPVLWTHYANKHKGICLGFNAKKDMMREVKYEANRLFASVDENNAIEDVLNRHSEDLLLTKFDHWSYEQEIRAFIPLAETVSEPPHHFYRFNDALQLAEIILGPECHIPVDDIRAFVKNHIPSAVVFRSRLALKYFAVVPDEKTVQKYISPNKQQ